MSYRKRRGEDDTYRTLKISVHDGRGGTVQKLHAQGDIACNLHSKGPIHRFGLVNKVRVQVS
jgi:hypothetical protein